MTNKIYIIALAVSIIFFLCKMIELKYIDKEGSLNIKTILRDTVVVYVSVVGGYFLVDQMMPADMSVTKATQVFTEPPNF
jgi:hypothetical protein